MKRQRNGCRCRNRSREDDAILGHEQLDVYRVSIDYVAWSYALDHELREELAGYGDHDYDNDKDKDNGQGSKSQPAASLGRAAARR